MRISTLFERVLLTCGTALSFTRVGHGIGVQMGALRWDQRRHAGGYGASGEEGASSSQQRTTECMPQSNDLSRSLAALGPAAGSFTVDFPEHRQASGWRRFLPWVFGLLTLFALVLVVLHFGTIEQFTRLAWAARPEWFPPRMRRPSSNLWVCIFGVAPGVTACRAPTIAQHSRSPWHRQAVHRSGGPKRRRQRRDFGCKRAGSTRSPNGKPAQQKCGRQSGLDCYAEQAEHADASCLECAQAKRDWSEGRRHRCHNEADKDDPYRRAVAQGARQARSDHAEDRWALPRSPSAGGRHRATT